MASGKGVREAVSVVVKGVEVIFSGFIYVFCYVSIIFFLLLIVFFVWLYVFDIKKLEARFPHLFIFLGGGSCIIVYLFIIVSVQSQPKQTMLR